MIHPCCGCRRASNIEDQERKCCPEFRKYCTIKKEYEKNMFNITITTGQEREELEFADVVCHKLAHADITHVEAEEMLENNNE